MSTKIYNGYRVRLKGPGFAKLAGFCQVLGEEVNNYRRGYLKRLIAKNLCLKIDALDAGVTLPETYLTQTVETRIHQMYLQGLSAQTHTALDLSFEVLFVADPDTPRELLCLLYCVEPGLKWLWQSQLGVFEYGYWNNVDEPENVTPKEWAHRGARWDRVLGDKAPANVGFSFKPHYTMEYSPKRELFPLIPSLKERSQNLAACLPYSWDKDPEAILLQRAQVEFEFEEKLQEITMQRFGETI